MSKSIPNQALDGILKILQAHPQGLKEYDLLKILRDDGNIPAVEGDLAQRLDLFQIHFLLFNALYRLQHQLIEAKRYYLHIEALNVRLMPYRQTKQSELGSHDAMREYYLDLSNLADTTATTVDDLLNDFWRHFITHDEHAAALVELELEPPVEYAVIKKQYKRLIMQHHPDRGGDQEKVQRINQAMEVLNRRYAPFTKGDSEDN